MLHVDWQSRLVFLKLREDLVTYCLVVEKERARAHWAEMEQEVHRSHL